MASSTSEGAEKRLFGTVERRLFRATSVLATLVLFAALICGIAWALAQVLSFFYNIIVPLCVAGILALVLSPLVDLLERHAHIPRVAATSLIILFFIAIIIAAAFLVMPILFRQVAQFLETAPGVLAGWVEYLGTHFPGLMERFLDSANDGDLKEVLPDMENTGEVVKSYVGMLVGLGLVPLLLFFALNSGGKLRGHTEKTITIFSDNAQKQIMYFIDVFVAQVTGFFQGQLVIALIMGIMFSIGFTVIGLNGGILVGLILGLLNIVPFLGTLVGLLIALPMAYFQPEGGFYLLGLAILVFVVVQLIESWVLTPKIMANRSGLPPGLVVIAVFFWGTALGGVAGMILAVPLTAFLVAVWRQTKASLTRSMESEEDASRITVQGSSQAARDVPDNPSL